MKKGKDLIMSVGGSIRGYATDLNWEIKTNTTQVSTTKYKRQNAAGKWEEYESDKNGWTADSSYVMSDSYDDYLALVNAQLAGVAIPCSWCDVIDKTGSTTEAGSTGALEAGTTGIKHSGTAFITSISPTAPVDGEVTYKIQLQGTGALEVAKQGA